MDASSHGMRELLMKARVPTASFHYIITEDKICSILHAERIRGLLVNELNVDAHLVDRYTTDICEKAQKILAILCSIGRVSALIEDFMNRGICDRKLPLTEPELPQDFAKLFVDEQQHFLAPVFTNGLFRDWGPEVILPFATDISIGGAEGGFASVNKIEIIPDFQKLTTSPDAKGKKLYFARKELKTRRSARSSAAFHREKQVLELLNHVHHPHIIPLLAPYIHGDRFNMIFPLADCDLEELLTGGENAKRVLIDQDAFWLQLLGITSALDTLHNFQYQNSEGLDFAKLGYHHDLKPQNILIKDGTFLLADFGLARLKDVTDDSKTGFKYGAMTYGAPEAHRNPLHGAVRVGRALDIWSWGCILIEAMTFAMMGSGGVGEFRRSRKTEVGMRTDFYFHNMVDLKPEVREWIAHLRRSSFEQGARFETMIAAILVVIEWMLAINPDNRLSSTLALQEFGKPLAVGGIIDKKPGGHIASEGAQAHALPSEPPVDIKVISGNARDNLADFLDDDHPVIQVLKATAAGQAVPYGGESRKLDVS